jgi:hypothetical protein
VRRENLLPREGRAARELDPDEAEVLQRIGRKLRAMDPDGCADLPTIEWAIDKLLARATTGVT